MVQPGARHVVGVDVGGTFTDLVKFDPESGTIRLAKVASTLDNQAFGVLEALRSAGTDLGARHRILSAPYAVTASAAQAIERAFDLRGKRRIMYTIVP